MVQSEQLPHFSLQFQQSARALFSSDSQWGMAARRMEGSHFGKACPFCWRSGAPFLKLWNILTVQARPHRVDRRLCEPTNHKKMRAGRFYSPDRRHNMATKEQVEQFSAVLKSSSSCVDSSPLNTCIENPETTHKAPLAS